MSRIIVIEIPDNIGSREAAKHLQQLDERINLRMIMNFERWVEIIEKEGYTESLPSPLFRGDVEQLMEHKKREMTTPRC